MPGNEPEDESSGGPPPDPSDRIWVHPTEMTSFVATTRPRASRRGRWVALAAGLTVVAAVAGVVALMTVDNSSRPTPSARSGAIQRMVATLAPSVVAVRTARGNETGRASGVCVQAGQIVTTAHAVDGAAAAYAADPSLDLERYGREVADTFVKATAPEGKIRAADVTFGIGYVSQIWVYRVIVWVLPVVFGLVTWWTCRELQASEVVVRQRHDAESEARLARLRHGKEPPGDPGALES